MEEWKDQIKSRSEILKKLQIGRTLLNIFDLESIPFLLCVFDLKNYHFVSVSKSSEVIMGYNNEEMEGKALEEFLKYKEEMEFFKNIVGEKLKNGEKIMTGINHYVHKNGKEVIKMEWYAALDENGFSFSIKIPVEKIEIK